jgi:hypothetical protein
MDDPCPAGSQSAKEGSMSKDVNQIKSENVAYWQNLAAKLNVFT